MAYVFTVKPGERVHLSDCDPGFTADLKHQRGKELLPQLGDRLTDLQETHYASGAGGILIVLQGLDTAGKDGTIRHVLTYFNPAGCEMHSFKVPTPEEAAHDFLWRAHRVTPAQSVIGIFNRSYYEDVLVTRVHELVPRSVWERRYQHINDFEALLIDSGTVILKFFLYISKEEQRERLLAREQDRDKAWKLSITDWREHDLYDRYVQAYEDALNRCSTADAPWYIVPANHKWFRNVAVAQTIVDRLEPLAAGWRKDLEARGREQLAAIARLHEHDT
jgi:PPK2 family polyphosphate:nucleotide phosphotransferase